MATETLEKTIRKIAPAKSYGYINYVLSEEYPIKYYHREPILIGEKDFTTGYNCVDINTLLSSLINGIVVEGKDEKKIFQRHYFVYHDNEIWDATPIFPFRGANHHKNHPLYCPSKQIYLNNPLCIDGDNLITLNVMKANEWQELAIFAVSLKNGTTKQYQFAANLREWDTEEIAQNHIYAMAKLAVQEKKGNLFSKRSRNARILLNYSHVVDAVYTKLARHSFPN